MQRRYKEHRHHRHTTQAGARRNSLSATLRKPGTQIAILLVAALIVFILLQRNEWKDHLSDLAPTIGVSDAYKLYQTGAFFLDVRTQDEWNQFHIPDTTLIPLDQLRARLNELPTDRPIVVVCLTGQRSLDARDMLVKLGFEQVTSMDGGLTAWRAAGYPIEP